MSLKKISIKNAMALLLAAGVQDVEIVADETTADKDFDVDDNLSVIDTSRRTVLEPLIEQELKPKIESAVTGKLSGTFRSVIKRLFKPAGLTEADIKDLKTEEEMLAVALQKYDANMGKDTASLREEITNMAAAHEQAITDINTSHANELASLTGKYTDKDIKESLLGDINKIPKKAGDAVFLTEGFMDYLKKQYHVVYDDNGKAVKLRKLDNKEAPAMNAKNTAELTPADLATEYLEKVGALTKDMRHVPPGNPNQNDGGGALKIDTVTTSGDSLMDVNKNLMASLDAE